MALMQVTQYAQHRGVQLRAVQFALERGRIHRNAEGLIDSDLADREWEENTNAAQARPGRKPRKDPAESLMRGGNVAGQEPTVGLTSFNSARTIKEIYDAKLKKLEHDERAGKLLPKRDVEVTAFNRARILRDAILNVPARLAARLAAEPDQIACHNILEQDLRAVLDEFSKGKMG